jgi:hypothetical protein
MYISFSRLSLRQAAYEMPCKAKAYALATSLWTVFLRIYRTKVTSP